MKTLITLLAFGALGSSLAQTLEADQNPNYQISLDKYLAKSDELTSTLSTTIQDTYEAYDWREAKEAKKQLRRDRSYELRKLRIYSRFPNCCNQSYGQGNYYGYMNQPNYGSNPYGYNNYYQGNNPYYSNNYWHPLYAGAGLFSLFF
jgi:hypothetical protein